MSKSLTLVSKTLAKAGAAALMVGFLSLPVTTAAAFGAGAAQTLIPDEERTIKLFEEATTSVVYIDILQRKADLFSNMATDVPEGTGSGFVWDKEGHIVTNYHVIAPVANDPSKASFPRVSVLGTDGSLTIYDGRILGFDPAKDIAVIDINAPASILRPMPVGTSADLKVGQKCFAIGNPFGLDHTLTAGVVSGLGRTIVSPTGVPISGAIQTDAAINPGNSGGPMLNSSGQLIGINTSILSKSGTSSGVGFAIPVDTVKRTVDMLITTGRVTRPGLGIVVAPDVLAQQLGVPKGSGALIASVRANSPAAKAGLRGTNQNFLRNGYVLGDVVVAVDANKVTNYNDLYRVLEGYAVGDTVNLTVVREGEVLGIQVQLEDLDVGTVMKS